MVEHILSVDGTFETFRRTLNMSVYHYARAQPAVRARPNFEWHGGTVDKKGTSRFLRCETHRHEPHGVNKKRPERIPIDPERHSDSRNATAAVAIDSLLQNSGRREHDYATRRIRYLGAGLRIAIDTLTLLEFSCHRSVSL